MKYGFMISHLWLIKVPPQESSLLRFGPLRILRRALHGLRRSTMPPTSRKLLSHNYSLCNHLCCYSTMMAPDNRCLSHVLPQLLDEPASFRPGPSQGSQLQLVGRTCKISRFGQLRWLGQLQPRGVVKMKRLLHICPSAFAGSRLFHL